MITPRLSPRMRQAHKKARPAQEGGLKSAGTMPKSHPGRNAGKPENRRFRTVFAPEQAVFARILEMAEGQATKRQVPPLRVQKLRWRGGRYHGPDATDRHARGSGGLGKGFESLVGDRAQDLVVISC
jgi:hypothetical protein